MDQTAFDQQVDLLVIDAGAGGMSAALTGAIHGLSVLRCEKTAMVGGTATSGGTTWVPGTALARKAGVPDSAEDAATFLRHVVGPRGSDAQRAAFLASGAEAIADLERHSQVRLAAAAHSDDLDGPGAAFGGRALGPVEFDGRKLGADFDRVGARRGVVLATCGIGWSQSLRGTLFPKEIAPLLQSPESNSGDGISLAVERAGAALDDGGDSPALWMPCSLLKRTDGSTAIWPHIILDRAKPGLIAVGADGRRFVNESDRAITISAWA